MKALRARLWVFLAVVLCAIGAPAGAQERVAIIAAKVHVGDGAVVENATVIVSGERIEAVGIGLAVPAGARRVDGTGKVLTSGLVAVGQALGLVEIDQEPSARDQSPEGGGEGGEKSDPVRAAFDAADGLNPRSAVLSDARSGGITLALAEPEGGLVSGTSALFDLRADTPERAIVVARAALHVHLDEGGIDESGGARPSAWMRLREALDDARLYAPRRAAFDRRQMRETRVSRLDLERLAAALAGRLPVVLRASRASDIERALALAREYRLRLILEGAEEGWVVAKDIAAAGVPVIVEPLANLPSSFAALGTRYDNAAMLAGAGVRVILTSEEPYRMHNLRQEAGNAVARGLPWERALSAITLDPARALGVDRDYGTVERGKIASLVLWSGDPFELSTRVERVFVRGVETPTATRQSLLFERYRTLPGAGAVRPPSGATKPLPAP